MDKLKKSNKFEEKKREETEIGPKRKLILIFIVILHKCKTLLGVLLHKYKTLLGGSRKLTKLIFLGVVFVILKTIH
jgi:hypothetical protein